jgi:hypothetical protein
MNAMGLNTAWKSQVVFRRVHVARLRVQGLTFREIVEQLPQLGVVNPKTQRPYSLGVVHRDIQCLEDEWRAEVRQSLLEHKARLLAKLQEVERWAWKGAVPDLSIILQVVRQQRELLGVDAPLHIAVTDISKEDVLELAQAAKDRRLQVASLSQGESVAFSEEALP